MSIYYNKVFNFFVLIKFLRILLWYKVKDYFFYKKYVYVYRYMYILFIIKYNGIKIVISC